ncbi:MAG: hypothetical protein WB507_03705 [Solirubrobacterales bacterium]
MAEVSLGHAVAVAALAPVAERLTDAREREARNKERERRLEEELQKIPEFPERERPREPVSEGFSLDNFGSLLFWGEVVSLAFIGPFILGPVVFGKHFTESGYPWLLLLFAPVVIAVLAGFLPVIAAMPERGRYLAEMEEYEMANREAAHRSRERAEVRERLGDTTGMST